jgi:peptidoglycan/LPS O-acetylase OafA/YrhL
MLPVAASTRTGPGRGDRIAGLDGLRAVAILMVILWHFSFQAPLAAARMERAAPLVSSGWAGVDLFFALSGFLITRLLLREEDAAAAATGQRKLGIRAFYVRRALRILPPFYFVLLLNFLVFGPLHLSSVTLADPSTEFRPLDVFAWATFWGNYFRAYFQTADPGQAFTVYWSLCVEEHFYLLWPALLLLVRGARARLVVATTVCLALMILRWVASAYALDKPGDVHFLSHYRMDSILWGAVGALAWSALAAHPRWRAAALAVAGALTVAILAGRHGTSPLEQSLGLTALAVTMTLVVVEAACRPRSKAVAVLESVPLRAIGKVSYGMYLLHFQVMELAWPLVFVLSLTGSPARWSLAFVLVAGLTWGAAALMYRYVERPFLALKDARFSAPHSWRRASIGSSRDARQAG